MSVFIFPATGEYYLGIVDTKFDSMRPRAGEIRQRRYRFRLWWGRCMYWDGARDEWSTRGCHILPQSTFHTAKCRYVTTLS